MHYKPNWTTSKRRLNRTKMANRMREKPRPRKRSKSPSLIGCSKNLLRMNFTNLANSTANHGITALLKLEGNAKDAIAGTSHLNAEVT